MPPIISAVLLITLFLLGAPGESIAIFHNGSVASCDGCHTADMALKGGDPSSTCLGCHATTYRVLTRDGSAYTPAGDFYWLSHLFAASNPMARRERHGHNVVAIGFGLFGDTTLVAGPSDGSVTYQSAWLQCTSCHDPHTTADKSYRLLGDSGYTGGSLAAGIRFDQAAPRALPCLDQGGNLQPETDRDHPDYGSGMSEWCTNCHSGLSGAHGHTAGNDSRMGELAVRYNAYLATGNLTGHRESSYDFLVPFERGLEGTGILRCARMDGPLADATVMCLSCHRAHASAFESIGRWDFGTTFLVTSPVLSSPAARHAYFGEDISSRYGFYQRSLCNKCHETD
jgi:hypothetical protein